MDLNNIIHWFILPTGVLNAVVSPGLCPSCLLPHQQDLEDALDANHNKQETRLIKTKQKIRLKKRGKGRLRVAESVTYVVCCNLYLQVISANGQSELDEITFYDNN